MRIPDKPTTPEQIAVLWGSSILLCTFLGSVGMWYSWRAPAEKSEDATQLMWLSLGCWGLALSIYGVRRLLDFLFG